MIITGNCIFTCSTVIIDDVALRTNGLTNNLRPAFLLSHTRSRLGTLVICLGSLVCFETGDETGWGKKANSDDVEGKNHVFGFHLHPRIFI